MFILFVRRYLYLNCCNLHCIFNKKKLFKVIHQKVLIFQLGTKNLCHLRMTPLCTISQHVNGTPDTTPAKKGPQNRLESILWIRYFQQTFA